MKNINPKLTQSSVITVRNEQKSTFESKKAYFISKRVFDIAFSLCALIALAPLIAILYIVILVCDGRPIFFIQKRVGKNGRLFNCYKFRTMKKNCPSYMEKSKLDADSFMTVYGKSMRSLSLDELPQFFNVLKGDMSVVGPRPMIQNHYAIHSLRKKYNVDKLKPGLTGLAQINGRDTISDEQKASYDKEYFEKCSFMLDIIIVIKSVFVVFFKEGYKEGR